jgi:hypothetical protein
MTARSAYRRQGFTAAALAKAEEWLFAPADAGSGAAEPGPDDLPSLPPAPPRPVVAVVGLARRCGATAVARAIGVELALRDPGGAAVVVSERVPAAAPALGTPASARLARHLRALGGPGPRPVGRLCLLGDASSLLPRLLGERPAPVVLDAGRDGRTAALSDRTVLVAGPAVEPALGLVVAGSLERAGPRPALLANRIEDPEPWEQAGALIAGESRIAAMLALAGREPRGRLGTAVRELVERWEGEGR